MITKLKKCSITLFLVVGLALLAGFGCGNGQTTYTFRGENENWKANFKATRFSNGLIEGELTVFYKGEYEDLAALRRHEVALETLHYNSRKTMEYPPESKTLTLLKSSSNRNSISKDEVVKVTIVLDDSSEILELTSP